MALILLGKDAELIDDTSTTKFCATAFEAVWEKATPHAQYQPT
jgi:hypothetical protein